MTDLTPMGHPREEIGKVTCARIGVDDGRFSYNITLDFGGAMQAICPFNLRGPHAGALIEGLLAAFGVGWFDEIKGRIIIAVRDDRDNIIALKPLPFERGTPFDLRDFTGGST